MQHDVQASFAVLRATARELAHLEGDRLPIVFSGNCMTAVATCASRGGPVGVVWFDAHGDFHTPDTTPTGFLDGMALAMVTGSCWRSLTATIQGFTPVAGENVVFVGGHDFDPGEEALMRRAGISVNEFERGVGALAQRANAVYVHVDLDVLDMHELRANQWSKPGGVRTEALEKMVRTIADAVPIAALGVVAYDPRFDERGVGPPIVEAILDATNGSGRRRRRART